MASADIAELLAAHPPMARPLPAFDAAGAPAAPGPLFLAWLWQALQAGVPDATALTLSTVGEDGCPDARTVVLRDLDADAAGWTFEADSGSPKGRQLAARPQAAMSWYWPLQGRQIRLRGTVRTAGPEESAARFLGRSPAARTADLVGRQSEPLGSWAEYEEAAGAAAARLASDPGALAPHHTAYTLTAREAEFWQGDARRRHVRLRYTAAADGAWTRTLLWP